MKPVISVLMSVYNEMEEEVLDAVVSILRQTFFSFEFIIINDNPTSDRICSLCRKISVMDKRIIVYQNSENIGLAMSLNKAASYAQGEFLARMDADDISYPTRFQKEYDVLKTGRVDIVCCQKDSGENLKHVKKYISKSGESAKLISPVSTSICHPSVMMTREIFEKAGGYRNFRCAQDIDLWYRLYEQGAVFCIINEALIFYRTRGNNISAKFMKQEITAEYIKNCFIQRLSKGSDSFSFEEYQAYLEKYLGGSDVKKQKINTIQSKIVKANIDLANGHVFRSRMIKLCCAIQNPTYRHIILKKLLNRRKIRALVENH